MGIEYAILCDKKNEKKKIKKIVSSTLLICFSSFFFSFLFFTLVQEHGKEGKSERIFRIMILGLGHSSRPSISYRNWVKLQVVAVLRFVTVYKKWTVLYVSMRTNIVKIIFTSRKQRQDELKLVVELWVAVNSEWFQSNALNVRKESEIRMKEKNNSQKFIAPWFCHRLHQVNEMHFTFVFTKANCRPASHCWNDNYGNMHNVCMCALQKLYTEIFDCSRLLPFRHEPISNEIQWKIFFFFVRMICSESNQSLEIETRRRNKQLCFCASYANWFLPVGT